MFFNVFQSVVVLLYVLDNETNFVIKVSCFVGLGIELWKITKVSRAFCLQSVGSCSFLDVKLCEVLDMIRYVVLKQCQGTIFRSAD